MTRSVWVLVVGVVGVQLGWLALILFVLRPWAFRETPLWVYSAVSLLGVGLVFLFSLRSPVQSQKRQKRHYRDEDDATFLY